MTDWLVERKAQVITAFLAVAGTLIVCLAVWPDRGDANQAMDFLQGLPSRWEFYLLVLTLAGLYAFMRALSRHAEGQQDRAPPVVERLRKRAFDMETWAQVALFAIVALLLGGVYFVVFLLPLVSVTDAKLRAQGLLESQYGVALDRIVEGRRWVKVAHIPELAGQRSVAAAFVGQHGVIAGNPGRMFATTDGGRTWTKSEAPELRDGEWLPALLLSKDGSLAVTLGSLGSVFVSRDGGNSWRGGGFGSRPPVPRRLLERDQKPTKVVDGACSGMLCVAIGGDGTRYLRTGHGAARDWMRLSNHQFWTGPDLYRIKVTPTLAVVGAAEAHGSFLSRDGGATWTALQRCTNLPIVDAVSGREGTAYVLATGKKLYEYTLKGCVKFKHQPPSGSKVLSLRTDGQNELQLVTKGGILSLANDAWSQSEPKLPDGETVVRVLDDGQVVLVGPLGSVSRWDDNGSWDLEEARPNNAQKPLSALVGGKGTVAIIDRSRSGFLLEPDRQNGGWGAFAVPELGGRDVSLIAVDGPSGAAAIDIFTVGGRMASYTREKGWSVDRLPIAADDQIVGYGAQTVLISRSGRFLTRKDDGDRWRLGDESAHCGRLPLLPREDVDSGHQPEFDAAGKHGVVVGEDGSVATSRDHGESWTTPVRVAVFGHYRMGPREPATLHSCTTEERLYNHGRIVLTASASPRELDFVGLDSNGGVYRLRERPELEDWREMTVSEVRGKLLGSDIDKAVRELYRPHVESTADQLSRVDEVSRTDEIRSRGNERASEGGDRLHVYEDRTLTVYGEWKLTLLRVVTLTVLFFLVRILVRIYQYTLRLSVFLHSRADAVSLSRNIALTDFKDLVHALGPEAIGFDGKPPS